MRPDRTRARIALLIETDGAGGAERMVAQLATELQTLGHSVVVYVPPRGDGWLGKQLVGSGIEIDHFWLTRPFDPGCARELASSFHNQNIELAHSHEFSLAFYGAWAARLAGIPHMITMHGRQYYADRFRRRLALRTAVMSSAVTSSVSQALARQLTRDLLVPRGRIVFIPNGVRLSPAPESTLRGELGLSERDRLVLSVGSLYPVKGHRHLLEAVAQLSERHPHLHVAIAGRGQLHDELLALGRTLGIAPRLHLLGLRPDVANLLAAADVFALPSLAEGLPLAVLEAMIASRPIIASEVGEVGPALAGGDAGILVRPGDAHGLAEGLDRLLWDRALAHELAGRAARRAETEYTLERMTERYDALYRALLTKKRRVANVTVGAA
ncbi:MAG: glycosyltransferase family 4 protein [Gemmatimonadetes bacterium]|nr:glycosyltransferase family 4 protein [Gemmatimonadota bacterium]